MGNWMSPYFRLGVKHVSNEHLARMVDLTHALDPAPWTVDCNMKAKGFVRVEYSLALSHIKGLFTAVQSYKVVLV